MDHLVLLMTVTAEDRTEPIAHGIYENLAQVLHGLHAVGIHPGFDYTRPMFNEDGSQAGAVFSSGIYVATVAAIPLSVAVALTRGETSWSVPDTAEGIEDA